MSEKFFVIVAPDDKTAKYHVPNMIKRAKGDVESFRNLYKEQFKFNPGIVDEKEAKRLDPTTILEIK